MPPASAVTFAGFLDPNEEMDFILNCSSILEVGEEIASYTLTLLSEAVALGVTIMSGSGRDDALITGSSEFDDNTAVKLWLEIDDAYKTNAAFNDPGTSLGMEITIVTNSVPARTRQRTALVKVIHQ